MFGTFIKTLNEVHRIQYDMNVSNLMRKLFWSRIKTGDGVVLPSTSKAAVDAVATANNSDPRALDNELIDAGQQIFVGNINAPEQRSYVRAQNQDLDLDPEKKPCAWFPVCQMRRIFWFPI